MLYENPQIITISKSELVETVKLLANSGGCSLYNPNKCDPMNPPNAAHGTYPDSFPGSDDLI